VSRKGWALDMASDSQSVFISYRRDEIWWAPAGIVMLAAIASLYGLYQVINSGPPGFAGGELSDITVVDIGTTGSITLKFNAVIKGYLPGEKCEVRWTLYDANTRRTLSDPKFQDQHAMYIRPKGYVDYRAAAPVKFPVDKSGKYYVELSLFPPDISGESKPLDVGKSETIQVQVFTN
jgi:hypothetical protein